MVTALSLTVDRDSAIPLSEQVRGSLRRLIEDGSLAEGSPLPSTRQLASDLEVSRSVVVEAYEQLVAEGYLATRRGSGTRVANGIGPASGTASALTRALPERTESAWDLRTGTSDLDAFPRREWLRSVMAAVTDAGHAELGYTPLSGAPHLRHVLAGHLGRTRGVRVSPQNLMITAGFAQGLALLCAMLREQGHTELGVEDPSHPGEREFIASAGLRPVGIPVDGEGLRVDLLERGSVRAVLTTPGNQFPTAVRLSAARRAALIAWARRVDGYILEDDFDCAYLDRSDRVPALQNLAPDRVVYAGSVSKVLAPALRLGWIAGPAEVMSGVEAVRAGWDIGCSGIEQLAFAHFVAGGAYDRHQRALRTEARKRRDLIRFLVAQHFPGARMLGGDSGIQAYVRLPAFHDEAGLVREARARSILVRGGGFYALGDRAQPPALVLGYATIDGKGLQAALPVLGEIYRVAGDGDGGSTVAD